MRAYISSLHKLAWVGYALALTVCSLAPVDLSGAPEHGDKVMHFLAYCLLVLLWPPAWLGLAGRFALAAALGLGIEIAQGVLPTGRFADPLDALANALGAALGVGIVRLWARRTQAAFGSKAGA
jgi:VanZ family protein